MTQDITINNFDEEVINSELPVLVDFWASWCGPCRMLGPVVEKLAADYEGKIKVCKVNVDEEQDLAVKHHVMSIPTLFLFNKGELVNRLVGARPYEDIQKVIEEVL